MLKNRRNGSVEIVRFLLAICIVLYHGMHHAFLAVPGGYLSVEAFFIISGYYLASHCRKTKNENVKIFHDMWKYVYRRVVSVYPQMFIGTMIGIFFLYYVNNWPLTDLLKWLRYAINDFFFIQNLGFPVASVTGVIWYLSSYLIAIIILYPIFAKYGRMFCLYMAPICTLFISGILIYNFGTFDVPANWIFGVLNTGNLRAISMICLGGFLYELVPIVQSRILGDTFKITILELILYFGFFLHMRYYSDGSGQFDEQAVLLFASGFIITESGRTYMAYFNNSKIALLLGKFSSALFWGHFIWVQNANALAHKFNFEERYASIIGLSGAIISSLLILILEKPIRKVGHFIHQNIIV